MESKPTENLTIKYNELTAVQFIELWETVWGGCGTFPEQAELAMKNTLFRGSVFDGGKIVGMARMLGDLGLDYFIKDVVVRPEYQKMGIGRLLIDELLNFVRKNGVSGTNIFVELCAGSDKIPFYEKFGFDYDESQRLKLMCKAE